MLGENELVSAFASGSVALDEIAVEALPDAMKPMAPEEQAAHLAQLAEDRADLTRQIRELSEARNAYLAKKVEEDGGMADSLDQKLYDTVREQAKSVGLTYESGPSL